LAGSRDDYARPIAGRKREFFVPSPFTLGFEPLDDPVVPFSARFPLADTSAKEVDAAIRPSANVLTPACSLNSEHLPSARERLPRGLPCALRATRSGKRQLVPSLFNGAAAATSASRADRDAALFDDPGLLPASHPSTPFQAPAGHAPPKDKPQRVHHADSPPPRWLSSRTFLQRTPRYRNAATILFGTPSSNPFRWRALSLFENRAPNTHEYAPKFPRKLT